MEALAEYRTAKGLGPISPWARGRFCTAYMKNRVASKFVESLGVAAFDNFIGLRADESDRVDGLLRKSTRAQRFRTPLFRAGIINDDVREFWSAQSFQLGLPEYSGNCG